MGMGKSLTTLVFIGKTLSDAHQWVTRNNALPKGSLPGTPCRATLIVVPQQCRIRITFLRDITICLLATVLINVWKGEVDG